MWLIRVLFLMSLTLTVLADSSYELRLSRQLAEEQASADAYWLKSGSAQFLALYRQQQGSQVRGAVILLHGMGAHPDWPDVIQPLRESLPELGWATLSLQMPVLSPAEPVADYGRSVDEAARRIESGFQQLKDWNYSNIVIIGYSFGAALAASALSSKDLEDVRAFVAISIQAQPFLNPRLKLLKTLEELDLPVLDIYGSRDMLEVRNAVHDRRLASRKGNNSAYQQMTIEGADHYYTGVDEVLIKRIQGWLQKQEMGPKPVQVPEKENL
ncbi:MAG: DUF3530 family protein [Gammaproteobacteria bacterium]|nr:DUF3530 family protein [Gammaproteobacteria bacterium]